MSRQNKVNPGKYTQRGRLTPDDAAREMAKQQAASPRRTEGGHYAEKAKSRVTEKDKDKDDEEETD